MIRLIKQALYFPIAYYFRFWAKIQLKIWKPKIIVVTGSSGKTTLLHLIRSQIGEKARCSHRANSSYGIPFDILGLSRKDLTPNEWFYLFFFAPLKAFRSAPKEKIYIIEADCDRPGEGKFLASFLNPDITLWTNSGLTHSANFDFLVKNKSSSSVEQIIAYEFGYFLEYTKELVIANGDNSFIQEQLGRSKILTKTVTKKGLKSYTISKYRTEFIIEDKKCSINFIVPKDVSYLIQMTISLLEYLKIKPDYSFSNFNLPPGRCNLLKGIKNTTIIDSAYNATPDGMRTILQMFGQYPSENKWVVLGDMTELGEEEEEEHKRLAELLNSMKLQKIILIGPRVSRYTFSRLNPPSGGAEKFIMPKDGLNYILENIKGKEVMLFKGARFLEGVIEHLLQNKNDINKLVRREKAWQNRRKAWEL